MTEKTAGARKDNQDSFSVQRIKSTEINTKSQNLISWGFFFFLDRMLFKNWVPSILEKTVFKIIQ
jgi:hypothetical protein